MLNVIMLSVTYKLALNAACHFAKCHYAECHKEAKLNVIILSVTYNLFKLSHIMRNAIMLSVIMRNAIMLSVVASFLFFCMFSSNNDGCNKPPGLRQSG
jgi:hypothetical protein